MTDQSFSGIEGQDKNTDGKTGKLLFFVISFVLLFLVGGSDFYDRSRFSYMVLYLLPVGILSWYMGRWYGLAGAFAAGALGFASQLKSPPADFHPNQLFIEGILNLAMLVVFSHLTARVRETRQMELKFSRTDSLTKTANVRAFTEMADQEIKRARRYNHPLTVICIDIDKFRRMNNDLGIQASNSLLFSVAYTLKKSIREVDTAARIGGDDFAILLPNTDEDQGAIVLERLRNSLDLTMKENNWPVTFSMGAASFSSIPESADDLLRAGSRLMLKAKEEGGNKTVSETIDSLLMPKSNE